MSIDHGRKSWGNDADEFLSHSLSRNRVVSYPNEFDELLMNIPKNEVYSKEDKRRYVASHERLNDFGLTQDEKKILLTYNRLIDQYPDLSYFEILDKILELYPNWYSLPMLLDQQLRHIQAKVDILLEEGRMREKYSPGVQARKKND
jgi:hypothetical protein